MMISNRLIKITFPIILFLGFYFLDHRLTSRRIARLCQPSPMTPRMEKYIADQEAKHRVKPENEARIIWNDSSRQKTPYSVVYLHGFSASQVEGDAIIAGLPRNLDATCTLRLSDHGVDTTEALFLFTPDRAWESAKEALAIGKQLGDKVIVMSTSTGGTLALMLAAEFPDDVFALINLSPNIAINDGAAFILNDPWGLYIARMVMGGNTALQTRAKSTRNIGIKNIG